MPNEFPRELPRGWDAARGRRIATAPGDPTRHAAQSRSSHRSSDLNNVIIDRSPRLNPREREVVHPSHVPLPAPTPIDEYLTPEQVAATFGASVDSVYRWFQNEEGVIDLGSRETMHKRRKRCLRIPRKVLDRFIAEHQVCRQRSGQRAA